MLNHTSPFIIRRYFLHALLGTVVILAGGVRRIMAAPPDPTLDIEIADIQVKVSSEKKGTIRAHVEETVQIAGQFRLLNPEQNPIPVVVRFTRIKNGRPVIYAEAIFMPTKEDGIGKFKGEIPAPKEPGSYQFQAHEGREILVNREAVIAPPASELP